MKERATVLTFTPAEEHVVRLLIFEGKSWKEIQFERTCADSTNRVLLQRALNKAGLYDTSYQDLQRNLVVLCTRILLDLFPELSIEELVQLAVSPPESLEELMQLAATQPPPK